jgi:hypothetical protein
MSILPPILSGGPNAEIIFYQPRKYRRFMRIAKVILSLVLGKFRSRS